MSQLYAGRAQSYGLGKSGAGFGKSGCESSNSASQPFGLGKSGPGPGNSAGPARTATYARSRSPHGAGVQPEASAYRARASGAGAQGKSSTTAYRARVTSETASGDDAAPQSALPAHAGYPAKPVAKSKGKRQWGNEAEALSYQAGSHSSSKVRPTSSKQWEEEAEARSRKGKGWRPEEEAEAMSYQPGSSKGKAWRSEPQPQPQPRPAAGKGQSPLLGGQAASYKNMPPQAGSAESASYRNRARAGDGHRQGAESEPSRAAPRRGAESEPSRAAPRRGQIRVPEIGKGASQKSDVGYPAHSAPAAGKASSAMQEKGKGSWSKSKDKDKDHWKGKDKASYAAVKPSAKQVPHLSPEECSTRVEEALNKLCEEHDSDSRLKALLMLDSVAKALATQLEYFEVGGDGETVDHLHSTLMEAANGVAPFLDDEDKRLRLASVCVIAHLGKFAEPFSDVLAEKADDEDVDVRKVALKAVRQLGEAAQPGKEEKHAEERTIDDTDM